MVKIYMDSAILPMAIDSVILELTQDTGVGEASRDEFIRAVIQHAGGNVNPKQVRMYFDTFLAPGDQSGG